VKSPDYNSEPLLYSVRLSEEEVSRMFTFLLLGVGAGSVAHGLRGERNPGKFITIVGNDSDNGLRLAERVFWIASGVCELVLAFIQLTARYKAA
jgi:hypothetical protein